MFNRTLVALNGLSPSQKTAQIPRLMYWWARNTGVRRRARVEDARADVENRLFDEMHGIHTGSRTAGHKSGSRYTAVAEQDFSDALSKIRVTTEHTFIDIGSGKGKAVYLASFLPFKQVVGVEFEASLNEIAVENLRNRPSASVVTADGAAYEFPGGPLVVFLANPFGPQLLSKMVNNLTAAWQSDPRDISVVYLTPRYRGHFDQEPWLELRRATPRFVVWQSKRPI